MSKSTLNYFLEHSGGIWTGCLKLSKTKYCKGALSAAVLLEAIRTLSVIAQGDVAILDLGSKITEGYIYAR
jgi:hypothetical protein